MRPLTDSQFAKSTDAPEQRDTRDAEPIRRVPQERLPGIEPLLFRELDHRISKTRLQHEPLPPAFLRCEDGESGGSLVFRGKRYNLNITFFSDDSEPQEPGQGSGAFVVSNGAGVATNTVDQLSAYVRIAGMIDLKQDFSEAKIATAFEMVRTVRPDLDALVIITQPWLHAPQCVQGMESGKHVYSAVPIISIPDGDEILDWCNRLVETCRKTGMGYMLAETTYHRPQAQFCRRKAAEGAFGRLQTSTANLPSPRNARSSYLASLSTCAEIRNLAVAFAAHAEAAAIT